MNCGTDIIYIPRIKNILKHLDKFFNEEEITYFNKTNNNIETIAGFFAAKEALLKCLKQGIDQINLKDISIIHEASGAPKFKFYGKLKKMEVKNFSLSISHDQDYAIAMVIYYLHN